MSLINSINVNSQGIGAASGYGAKSKSKEEAQEAEENKAVPAEQSKVSADDVFKFMAQSAVSVKPAAAKTVDPSKYVDEESAARIAGFMADFEDKVAVGLKSFDKEFEGADVSDSAKMAVVLKQINSEA